MVRRILVNTLAALTVVVVMGGFGALVAYQYIQGQPDTSHPCYDETTQRVLPPVYGTDC